jgi:HEAT repeat protein
MDEKSKHLLALLKATDKESRNEGLSGILKLPKFAQAEFAPEFVKLLREGNEQAARGLRYLGIHAERVLPQLIECLQHENPNVRLAATSVLCEMPNVASSAVPALIEMMVEDDVAIRSAAIRAAGRILTPVDGLVPALVACLRDSHYTVRSLAASALGRLGAAAREAVPALVAVLDDVYEPTRILTLQALEKIGSGHLELIAPISKLLYDPYPSVASEAAAVLARFGIAATAELTTALESSRQVAIIAVLDALARFSKDFAHLSPKIEPLLTHSSAKVRQSAISAFYKLSPNEAPPKLLDALKDENIMVRQRAASYLKNFRLPDAITVLTEALHDTYFDYFARTCLMETLAVAETHAGNTALINFLRAGQTTDNRCAASDAVRSMRLEEAVPMLIENMDDADSKVRHHTVMTLERLVPVEAIPVLIERLNDEVPHIRDWAEKALIKIGAPVVPLIAPALQDAHKQTVAKRILAQIGTPEALRYVENL